MGRTLSFGVAAALAFSSTACSSFVAGDHEAETKFLLGPNNSTGDFFGWSEVTFDSDTSQVDRATIFAATLELMNPGEAGDLTFIKSLKGEAVTPEERTLVVQRASFTPGETLAELDVVYTDDIRPFFPDGHTIRVEWTGQTNPAFTGWPAEGGFWIKVKVGIEVE